MAIDLPFNCLHKTILINMIYFYILWLNVFPVKNGVSQEFSPRSIVLQTNMSWKKHCRIKFGDYAGVHDEPDPINAISPHTHPSIPVSPTGNFNGTINFFCLITGRILKCLNFTRYPMPDIVIQKQTHGVRKSTPPLWEGNGRQIDGDKQAY